MKLTVSQLPQALQQLSPVYCLVGDEPLQLQESSDNLRARAKQLGYAEREVYLVDSSFDWTTLSQAAASLSLFSQLRIIELQLTKLPDKHAQKALNAYVKAPAADVLLIVQMPTVPFTKQKTAWFQTLEQHSQMLIIQEIKTEQLPQWLSQRAKQRLNLEFEADALRCLVERSEGHLLAAAQELEKLKIFYDPEDKGVRLQESHVITLIEDNARYQVFAWLDSVLAGKVARNLHQLKQLRESGLALVVIVSLLGRELRLLNQLAFGKQQGQNLAQLFKKHHVWRARERLLKASLQRHSLACLQDFLDRTHQLEQAVKGNAKAVVVEPWADLNLLAQQLSQ